MSPLKLSFAERRSLKRLVRHDGTCYQEQIKASHAERFLRDGLITRSPMRYHLTVRGQTEILRQRFRGVKLRPGSVRLDETNTLPDMRTGSASRKNDEFLFIDSTG